MYTRRWKGYTKKDVSERMSALATQKAASMSVRARRAHAAVMVEGKRKRIGNTNVV